MVGTQYGRPYRTRTLVGASSRALGVYASPPYVRNPTQVDAARRAIDYGCKRKTTIKVANAHFVAFASSEELDVAATRHSAAACGGICWAASPFLLPSDGPSPSCFLLSVPFQRFLIALSVRPGSSFAISVQRLPNVLQKAWGAGE